MIFPQDYVTATLKEIEPRWKEELKRREAESDASAEPIWRPQSGLGLRPPGAATPDEKSSSTDFPITQCNDTNSWRYTCTDCFGLNTTHSTQRREDGAKVPPGKLCAGRLLQWTCVRCKDPMCLSQFKYERVEQGGF
jgi:hypothetical protein